MLGLKNLTFDRLTTAFMVISAALVMFAAAAPADSASTTTLLIWIVGALVLIGVWIATAYEVFKRFFGGGDRQEHTRGDGGRGERSSRQPEN